MPSLDEFIIPCQFHTHTHTHIQNPVPRFLLFEPNSPQLCSVDAFRFRGRVQFDIGVKNDAEIHFKRSSELLVGDKN